MARRLGISVRYVALTVAFIGSLAESAHATDYNVSNASDFAAAINSIDASPTSSDRIILSGSFTMTGAVMPITTTGSLTVVGNGNTINGGGAYRPFFIESGNVTLQNLTITNALAHGGNGANGNGGGGGGLGAGAAVFVDSSGHLTIQNVTFSSDSAVGGNGGTGAQSNGGGGGGGLGANGGTAANGGGGGGGLYGTGGTAGNGGGGGGGVTGSGGGNSNGGGGGGATTNGSNGSGSNGGAGSATGGGGGGGQSNSGTGGTGGTGASNGSAASGNNGGSGGSGGTNGGGGGGGESGFPGTGGNGATGGLFGGGGGGGEGIISGGSVGGAGGDFGGGGGAGERGNGGNGGFGGGGGGGSNGPGSTAGFGGGSGGGNSTNGNGGSAYGGAVFIRQGGQVTFIDSTGFSSNTVTAGTGATNGSTDGNDIYLMRGTTSTFNITGSNTLTFAPVIGNNDGTSNAGVIIDKTGSGTLVLTANSTLSGATTVDGGTLQLNGSLGGSISVSSGATLSGNSTLLNQTITNSGNVTVVEGSASSYNLGNVVGAGTFTKDGIGTLTATGTMGYSGGTYIAAGTLIGTTSNLQGTMTNSGNVTFNQNSTGTYSGSMSGTGSVRLGGTGLVIFAQANSYTGGTTVSAGTLQGTTDSLQGTITDSGNITFNQSSDGTFSGSITGTGSVTIAGTGNVFFTGTNSYSGGTNVNSGTLTLVNAGSYSGFNGNGALDINAPGTTTVSGNNTFFGGTSVNAGTLVVTGTLGGSMTVNSGGVLMGVGTVGDTTISTGGTIYPGIVGAPLTINGNFTQNTGTTYSAEVSPIASDQIIVNGSATIQSGTTFNVVLDPGTYTAGTRYVVLTASGGITGTYTTTIMPAPGTNLFFSLDYELNEIDLIINNAYTPPDFASFAQTFNQSQVGTALDVLGATPGGSMASLITQLEGLSPNQIPGALNQLAGDIYPSVASIELQTTTTWLQLISNRLGAKVRVYEPPQGFVVNEKPTSNDPDAEVYLVSYQPTNSAFGSPMRMNFRQATRRLWSAWTQGYGLGGNVASNGNAGALNYGLGGTTFGIDRWLGERTLVGVLGGYAGSSANDVLVPGRSSINGYQVGLYGMHCRDYVYLSNIDAYSNDTYDATRQISIGNISGTAKSNTYGNQWAHYSEMGATFTGASVRLQPFGGIQYVYLDQNAFGETGVTPANLNVSQQITNSVRGSAGARLSWLGSIGNVRVIPVVHGRYQREWGDGTRLVTSSFTGAPTVAFNTTGNTLGRDFGLFGLGMTAMITPRTSLYGGYDLQVASRYAANMGSAGFQFRW